MPKKPNSERGSARYHRGGWELSATVDGERRFTRLKGENSRAKRLAAWAALDPWISSLEARSESLTVEQAIERYRDAKSPSWSLSTRAAHPHHAAPIVTALGEIKAVDLKSRVIQAVYEGWIDGGTSAGTVRRRHSILSGSMNYSMRMGWIETAPTSSVDLPTTPRKPMDLPAADEVVAALGKLPPTQDRLAMIATLALASGARRGELCALRWSDLDLGDRTLRIVASLAEGGASGLERKGTKSGGTRTIALHESAIDLLDEWRRTCVVRSLSVGVVVSAESPIFPASPNPAEHVRPSRVGQDWRRHRGGIGLPALRFHDLRHRHATSLLEGGVPVHEVSRRLGHASPAITLSVYAHALAEHDTRSADVIARAMGAS